jgi:uncharacterized membrane-anchored protein
MSIPFASSTPKWLNKVPEVTFTFWIIKIMSTMVGETGADYLAVYADWGQSITRGVMAACLLIALFCSYVRGAIFLGFIGLPLC